MKEKFWFHFDISFFYEGFLLRAKFSSYFDKSFFSHAMAFGVYECTHKSFFSHAMAFGVYECTHKTKILPHPAKTRFIYSHYDPAKLTQISFGFLTAESPAILRAIYRETGVNSLGSQAV